MALLFKLLCWSIAVPNVFSPGGKPWNHTGGKCEKCNLCNIPNRCFCSLLILQNNSNLYLRVWFIYLAVALLFKFICWTIAVPNVFHRERNPEITQGKHAKNVTCATFPIFVCSPFDYPEQFQFILACLIIYLAMALLFKSICWSIAVPNVFSQGGRPWNHTVPWKKFFRN